MRAIALVMVLALGAGAASAEEQAAPKRQEKKTIVLDGTEVKGDAHLPGQLVLTRSKAAKADVDSTSTHLEDAANRR